MFHYTPSSNHENLQQMCLVHEGPKLLQSREVLQHVALHAGLLTYDWWMELSWKHKIHIWTAKRVKFVNIFTLRHLRTESHIALRCVVIYLWTNSFLDFSDLTTKHCFAMKV